MGGSITSSRRVFIQDSRGGEGFLRATWHAEGRTVVFSTWEGDLCVGATRIRVEDSAELIGLLARALAEASTTVPSSSAPLSGPPSAPVVHSWRQRLAAWVRQARGRVEPPELAGDLHWLEEHRQVV
jgi:hypothetical protein